MGRIIRREHQSHNFLAYAPVSGFKKKSREKELVGPVLEKTCNTVSTTSSWSDWYVLNVAEVGVGPVEMVVGVVDGDAVGPLDLGGDDRCFVGAVHPNASNKGLVAPVRPVDKSEKRRKKIILSYNVSADILESIACQPNKQLFVEAEMK